MSRKNAINLFAMFVKIDQNASCSVSLQVRKTERASLYCFLPLLDLCLFTFSTCALLIDQEFHTHFKLERSPFSDMAFGQLTKAGSGNRDLVL
jgi:hypothetical protein